MDKINREDCIYLQWYPHRFTSGYCIIFPTKKALEAFYENVRASDPCHESFVIIIDGRMVPANLDMATLREYVLKNVLPFYCNIK